MYVYTHERQHLRCRSQMMCNAWWTDYKENKCQRPNIMVDDLKAKFTLLNFFLSFLLADLQKTDRLPCVCVCGVSLHCLHCYIAVWIDVCIATYGRYIANVTLLCVVMFHCYIAMCCDVTLLHCYCCNVTLLLLWRYIATLPWCDVYMATYDMVWYCIAMCVTLRCVMVYTSRWWYYSTPLRYTIIFHTLMYVYMLHATLRSLRWLGFEPSTIRWQESAPTAAPCSCRETTGVSWRGEKDV